MRKFVFFRETHVFWFETLGKIEIENGENIGSTSRIYNCELNNQFEKRKDNTKIVYNL